MFATVHSEPVTGSVIGGMRSCHVCAAIYRNDFQRCPTDGGELTPMVADPLIGKTVGNHYVVDALIGEGAMGRVYRAHHSRLVHKRYALKVLLGDLAASTAMRIRFQNEAEAASRLCHPGVVGVVDFGRTRAGLMYLVMELVEGPSLRRLLREGTMSPERVTSIARDIASGLAHAHERGVVHRDLKPDNVLVVGDAPRIADFGLAISITGHDARLTTSGVMCTPLYAAPEQLLGKEIDHRVDLYALGATMFEMLTGVAPFRGDANQVVAKKLGQGAPRVSSIAPSVPSKLAAIVDRLLARKPAARFANANEVVEALDALMPRAELPPWQRVLRRLGVSLGAFFAIAAVSTVDDTSRPATEPETLAVATQDDALSTSSRETVREVVPVPVFIAVPQAAPAAKLPAPPVKPVAKPAAPIVNVVAQAPVPERHAASRITTQTPRAGAMILDIDVAGSLPPSVVRRAVERVLPQLQNCQQQVGARVVSASFAIGETRRASSLEVHGQGARCVTSALASVRTEVMPDVGDASVLVKLSFGG